MIRQRSRRALALGTTIVVVLLVAGCAASPTNDTAAVIPASLFVEGYGIAAPSTLTALARDKGAVDMVGISGVSLTPQGEGVAASSQEALDIAQRAKHDGARSELLVNNIDAAKGDFSTSIATAMLSSESNREFVISGLAAEVDHGGYDGIQLDLEYLTAANARDLVTFASELRAALPKQASVSVALMASTTKAGYAASGYDVPRLSRYVDRFVLMAYDEHGSGFSAPGPVGGLPWTDQAVAALTELVAPSKIVLGVAGYGYTWKTNGTGGVVTPAEARKEAGGQARWVEAQGEWTAKLANGTILWWSDGRSLTVRSNLAVSDKLKGVALWQMSTGDVITRSK